MRGKMVEDHSHTLTYSPCLIGSLLGGRHASSMISGEARISQLLRSKILSLQLLLHLLRESARLFQSSDMFVTALKKHLVLSLCTNALYAHPQVLDLTLRIFMLLLTVFPAYLKV